MSTAPILSLILADSYFNLILQKVYKIYNFDTNLINNGYELVTTPIHCQSTL